MRAKSEGFGDVSLESRLKLGLFDSSSCSFIDDLFGVTKRDEKRTMLVDGSVGEMFEGIHATGSVLGEQLVVIFLSSEADQAFLVEMNREGMERGNESVDAHIELVALKKPGVLNIELSSVDAILRQLDGGEILNELNSSTLTSITRLHNPSLKQKKDSNRVNLC